MNGVWWRKGYAGQRVKACARGSGEMEYYASDDPTNLGGGCFHPNSSQMNRACGKLQFLSAVDSLRKFDIRDVDSIKNDTEGAEHDTLTGFPPDILSRHPQSYYRTHDSQK